MESRKTRQKYVILKALKENRNHPTISEIYEDVKKIDPTIGQATVYRNVKQFVKENEVVQLPMQEGVNHYDYYKDHFHFECLNCGKIIDIFDDELLKKLVNRFQNREEEINIYNLMLEGYCSSCKKEKEKEGKQNGF